MRPPTVEGPGQRFRHWQSAAPVGIEIVRAVWTVVADDQVVVAVADLDGDGHYDLVIGNYCPDGADYLDPNGSGRLPMTESLSRSFNGGGPHFFLWKKSGGGK